jgi:hypothetical protein
VSDYYERLEQQLMQATARALPSGRRASIATWRPRGDLFAGAAALIVAAAVVAVFIGLRPSALQVKQHPGQHGLAVVHNYVNGAVPVLGGAFSCETGLAPAQADRSRAPTPWNCYLTGTGRRPVAQRGPRARGTVIVNVKEPLGDVFSIDASGLPSPSPHGDYAVWLLSARSPGRSCGQNGCPTDHYSLVSGRRPAFVGIVTPPVGADGRLRAHGLMPTLSARQATGSYLFVIARQTHPSDRSVGQIVLEGWLSF